ncbi:MAG: DUF3034 family protein [Hahellaceae bacterium]|nr:DUF3034 family protein [Hahellaceae bacterium]
MKKASRPYLPKPPFSPLILGLNLVLTAHPCLAGSGKLLGTPGTTQLEGSAGGGLVPWAGLAGYATSDEVAVSAFATQVNLDDFRLDVWGAAANLYDRIEVSVAQQRFYVQPLKSEIEQAIFGLKTRVAGDLVFDELPQISLGTQLKHLQDKQIARSVGAKSVSTGADVYLTASKLHLAAAWGYNVLWNITVRGTRANQLGLLGYGGDTNNNYRLEAELSSALLITPQWALGVEYRQKPNNLSALKETDWKDVFLAYFPNKHLNMTIAWADLGEIAGQSSQQGTYISITGYLW